MEDETRLPFRSSRERKDPRPKRIARTSQLDPYMIPKKFTPTRWEADTRPCQACEDSLHLEPIDGRSGFYAVLEPVLDCELVYARCEALCELASERAVVQSRVARNELHRVTRVPEQPTVRQRLFERHFRRPGARMLVPDMYTGDVPGRRAAARALWRLTKNAWERSSPADASYESPRRRRPVALSIPACGSAVGFLLSRRCGAAADHATVESSNAPASTNARATVPPIRLTVRT
jgi:hypothetical protein